jgi:RNA polymerase sigma-70 factor (ECF subfamily)
MTGDTPVGRVRGGVTGLCAAGAILLSMGEGVKAESVTSIQPVSIEIGAGEQSLIDALRQGDNRAYERLIRDFGPRMLAVARRVVRSDTEAEEAVQDAFISAFRAIGTFEGGAKLSTWLHRITVNAALMRLRKTGRIREGSIEAMLPSFGEDGHAKRSPSTWRQGAGAGLAGEETRAMVMAAIDKLPEAYRVVIMMRDVDGLSTLQAAQLLGDTETAVKVRLHRARLALRELLDPQMAEGRL